MAEDTAPGYDEALAAAKRRTASDPSAPIRSNEFPGVDLRDKTPPKSPEPPASTPVTPTTTRPPAPAPED